MTIDKNERKIARELIDVFSKTESLKNYFQSDIKWLQDRLTLWNLNYIRVGLVGVTSSGKSTLLNAILGDDILPTAVRPSSGTLITCSKGKSIEASVYFENGHSIKIKKHELKEQLQKYGDESFNQENKYKVKIIDLKSPNYVFPENIQIIDSPGLDAYGLERHEQITMELLLPTVDLCMYVVTLKANSDSVTHNILHTIHDYQKPLIIVQNMLDSVEAKVGKNGVILKTRQEVAAKHKIRVERVLNQVDPNLAQLVDIVQLSAKSAVDGRREDNQVKLNQSQFPQLMTIVEKHVNVLRPILYKERTTQIYRHLIRIQENEEKFLKDVNALEQVMKEQKKELDSFRNEELAANHRVLKNKQILEYKISDLGKLTEEAIQKIKRLIIRDLDGCKRILNKVKDQAKDIEIEFIDMMRSVNKELSKLFDLLNLQSKDYEIDLTPMAVKTDQHFSVKKKIKTESYKIEKSGFGGSVARFFGKVTKKDWGYETGYDEYETIDVEAISLNLKSYQEIFSNHVRGYMNQWQSRAESFLYRAREEIQRRIDSYQEKTNNLLETQEIVEILFELKKYTARLKSETNQVDRKKPKAKNKQTVEPQSIEKMVISEEVFGLYQLGHYMMSIPFKKCWEMTQRRNEEKCRNMVRSVIWGWDSASILQFTQRYTGIEFTEKQENQLEKSGVIMTGGNNQFFVVNENKAHREMINQLTGLLQSGQYNMYVLLNLIQIGAAEKNFQKSALLTMPHIHNQPVNCVIQSFAELKNANIIEQGMQALLEKMNDWDIFRNGEILINDKNPLYSMICLELSEQATILADAQEVLRKVKDDYRHLLSPLYEEKYIRDFVKSLIDVRKGVLK